MKPVLLFIPLWVTVTAQVQVLPIQRPGLPPQDQATGKASIEGTVLDAITREPVKKASVMLISRLGLSAVTDASGHFAFRQLPAGRYSVQARSDKYPAMQDLVDTAQQISISLAADEQKQDITVSLTPGASVRGRIVDEEGSPMRCGVLSMQFRDTGTGRTLQQSGFSQSDEKGEYRISNLPRGKYYIQVRCNQSVPLPHAFIRRASTADLPTLTYPPVFYPTASEPMSAAKVDASPGADISGIDFRMIPARGVTVRGHVGSAPDRNVQLTLVPKDSVGRDWQKRGEPVNPSTGEFRIPGVLPGSYDLVAATWGDGPSYFAKVPVEVGGAPLEPIDLTLAAAPAISGTISFEGDTKVPMNSLRVMVGPLDGGPMMGRQAEAEVQSDGTFILSSVLPGHWRLIVSGLPGYVKSVKQGDQDVPAWDLETGSSAVQLKVVVGAKYAQVEAALATAQAGSEQVSGILWPASGDPQFQQNFPLNPQGPSRMSVPPGRYYACAFQAAQPGMLMQNRALRKALESHCETVEASEDGTARVQVPIIPAADLKQILEKIEE
jgi:hypothetical protein